MRHINNRMTRQQHAEILKLVYAWIGPRGPIWNTELPHVMSFAGAGEQIQPQSRNWWQDDLWQRVFRYRKEGWVLWANSEITEDDIFLYPFSLAWRIPFNNYFFGNNGILEYGHMSNHILHFIRAHKGFILVDLAVEAFVGDDNLLALHNYFNVKHGLPMNKIIYLTGCMNANQIYQDFCKRRNIPDRFDQRLNLISYPSSMAVYSSQISHDLLIEPTYNTESIPEKKFLCWNRRFRQHRTQLALGFEKHNLIDKSYFSMGMVDPERPQQNFRSTVDLNWCPALQLNEQDVDGLIAKLPLIIDNQEEITQMCEDNEMKARSFYTNSLVSVVTETNYTNHEVTLTEKSFKPAKEKHPFILVGAYGALASMRNLGFKTFGDFWDESYDTIGDPQLRLKKILEVCQEIASWDDNKVIEFKRKVQPLLEWNFRILRQSPAEMVSEKIAETMVNELFKTGKMHPVTVQKLLLNIRGANIK